MYALVKGRVKFGFTGGRAPRRLLVIRHAITIDIAVFWCVSFSIKLGPGPETALKPHSRGLRRPLLTGYLPGSRVHAKLFDINN
jgi:hypothetical protein